MPPKRTKEKIVKAGAKPKEKKSKPKENKDKKNHKENNAEARLPRSHTRYEDYVILPVTVNLLMNREAHFIKKQWVSLVGQCVSVRIGSYETVIDIDDSTGIIEAKVSVTTSANENMKMYDNKYLYLVGTLNRSHNNKLVLIVEKTVDLIEDFNRITYHLLTARMMHGSDDGLNTDQNDDYGRQEEDKQQKRQKTQGGQKEQKQEKEGNAQDKHNKEIKTVVALLGTDKTTSKKASKGQKAEDKKDNKSKTEIEREKEIEKENKQQVEENRIESLLVAKMIENCNDDGLSAENIYNLLKDDSSFDCILKGNEKERIISGLEEILVYLVDKASIYEVGVGLYNTWPT